MSQLDLLTAGRKLTIWAFQSHWSLVEKGLMATIDKTSPDKICLRLLNPGPRLPLKEGGRVRIKSWTGEALYFWDAEVTRFPIMVPVAQS
jgi:hypothetical protein